MNELCPIVEHCYRVIDTPATWEEGQAACQGLGDYTLANIDDTAEHEYLDANFPQLGNADGSTLWIGDKYSSGAGGRTPFNARGGEAELPSIILSHYAVLQLYNYMCY